MSLEELTERLRRADPTLFDGTTAPTALGWLESPERFLGEALDEIAERLPRRYERAILLGMGGSSSPARFFAEAAGTNSLEVLDTSNPDTIAATDFSAASVLASSKSGTTVETQTLLAHALVNGLDPRDLVVVTDPGTSLDELASSLDACVVHGDPHIGGRYSALSPFGLVPALYAGWSPDTLRDELGTPRVDEDVVTAALEELDQMSMDDTPHVLWAELRDDPALSGGALWLEQLLAETTGKSGRGVIPLAGHGGQYRPSEILMFHLLAALAARHLGVDPFNQPNVESAKRAVFEILSSRPGEIEDDRRDLIALAESATYRTLQVYAPLAATSDVVRLRRRVADRYGATTANLGPRYLHSTGQLHKGGPSGVLAIQVIVRPTSTPQRIQGRAYSFHDLHRAQSMSDRAAMIQQDRTVRVLVVEDLSEAESILQVTS